MPRFIGKDGIALVRVIAPGRGSSATYKEDQLKRDAAVFKGAQVYLDHPSTRERVERPERSIRDLVGVAVGDPEYHERGLAGPGVYSPTKVFAPYREMIEELAPHIGVSIRADGTRRREVVDGQEAWVAEKFTSGSYDFVTQAGAGGKVVPMQESSGLVAAFLEAHPQESETSDTARTAFAEWALAHEQDTPQEQEDEMAENERITVLEGQVATLTTEKETLTQEASRLRETAILREAREIVLTEVAKATDLHELTRTRLTEALVTNAPTKEGALDKEALTATVTEAIKQEKQYLESIGKPGRITGMGAGSTSDGKGRLKATMLETYRNQGIDQARAELMAEAFVRGR